MKRSENIIEFAKAMNLAQKEMRPAIKDSTNPHFHSKYSDLASVMEAIRDPMGNNGLSIMQETTLNNNGVSVITLILHTSGQWIELDPLTIPIGKRDAHAVGSACSYGKRYALCAALGVVSDDDDGNGAVASNNESKSKQIKYTIKPNEDVDISDEPIKYISKSQLKIFNEKYEQVSSPSSEYYDEKTYKMIDQAISHLDIEGFPSMEKMQEKDWIKFMKAFDNYFNSKKK